MHTPGPTPLAAHCPSVVQGTHLFVVVSQIGLPAVPQSALVTHSTQAPLSAQIGRAANRPHPVLPAAILHDWQVPVAGAQKGLLSMPHVSDVRHSAQRPEVMLHIAAGALHAPAPAAAHPAHALATQKPRPGSPVQWAAAFVHSTQRPDAASHAGVAALFLPQPSPGAPIAVQAAQAPATHSGRSADVQSAAPRHATQRPDPTSHSLPARDAQSAAPEHFAHTLPRHSGVAAGQS
jgi:hypothetical protein